MAKSAAVVPAVPAVPAKPVSSGISGMIAETLGDVTDTAADVAGEVYGSIRAASITFSAANQCSYASRAHKARERALARAAALGIELDLD